MISRASIDKRFVARPSLDNLMSQTCTAEQFSEPHYTRLAKAINQPVFMHRKQWEYIYIARALEHFGLMSPAASGLGFGCGKEPIVALMARDGVRVLATDIAPEVEGDHNWGSRSAMDLFYGGICSEEKFQQQVSFRDVNMNSMPADLGTHDFVWSCCALEHLGSLGAGMDFIVNSLQFVKPGGIAIHTTELNVSSDDDTLESTGLSLYRKRDILGLQDRLHGMGCSLLPLNFYAGSLPADLHIDLPPYRQALHLKLQIERYVVTSFGLVICKA
jgi:2-polyprenyl-3-methyl-5-hydroxy-6-metoxy-1,4-benzoquinol methylase